MNRSRAVSTKKNDYEEDYGRTESQQFLDLVKYGAQKRQTRKIDKFLQEFQISADNQVQAIKSLLIEQKEAIQLKDSNFLNEFGAAHSSVLANFLTTDSGNDALDNNSNQVSEQLRDKTTSIIGDALGLVKHFEEANRRLASQQSARVVEIKWKDDVTQLKDILDVGRQVGKNKVDKIILGMEPHGDEETARVADLLFGPSNIASEDATWAVMAQTHEKALKTLTRTLLRA